MNLKVKLWDNKNKQMLHEGHCFFQGQKGLELQAFSFEGQPDREDEVLLMYTGINDQDDKEVCEGDIIQATYGIAEPLMRKRGQRYKVVYHNAAFKVVDLSFEEGLKKEPLTHKSFGTDKLTKYRIIGNIYENSELLLARQRTPTLK